MVRRLSYQEVTADRWRELAETISVRQQWPKPLEPGYFFPEVQRWIKIGMAEAWGSEDGKTFLVGLFTRNPYTGILGGMVFCWWSVGQESNEAFELFEKEALRRKCEHSYVSVFGDVREKAISRLYRKKGFVPHERILRKFYG